MPLWHTTDQALAAPATAAQPHHLGIGGGLVDEHKVRRIKHALFSHPASARPRHVRALLLRRAQAFFEGDLVDSREFIVPFKKHQSSGFSPCGKYYCTC